jgi:hypothetical protein
MSLITLKEITPFLAVFSPIIAILISGLWSNRSLEKLKARIQSSQTVVAKRVELYSNIQEPLNEIYCYIKRVGSWKEYTPEDVIDLKRSVDKKIYSSLPFWSEEMRKTYFEFMDICFETNRGHRINAGIIADPSKYRELQSWKPEFEDYFCGSYSESKLDEMNIKLMSAFSKDFGVK